MPLQRDPMPWFITGPAETDILMGVMAVFLVLFFFTVGILMLRLHHLPEHMAHRGQKAQYQMVAVLSLLSMFTHDNLLWIAALLLALVTLPDFSTPLQRIAHAMQVLSRQRSAGRRNRAGLDRRALRPSPQQPDRPQSYGIRNHADR